MELYEQINKLIEEKVNENKFSLDKDSKEIVRCGHTGEEYGISCRLYHYPGKDLTVVILANQGWCAGPLGLRIQEVLMKWQGDVSSV